MFIIQVTSQVNNSSDKFLDPDMCLVSEIENAQVYQIEHHAIAAKTFIRNQWGHQSKILDYNPAV
jgi:hypothetical protein